MPKSTQHPYRDFRDVVIRARDVMRTRPDEPRVMSRPDVRSAEEADRGHPGRYAGANAMRAVLDDDRRFRCDAELSGRMQEKVGMRLAARDHRRAENVCAETRARRRAACP